LEAIREVSVDPCVQRKTALPSMMPPASMANAKLPLSFSPNRRTLPGADWEFCWSRWSAFIPAMRATGQTTFLPLARIPSVSRSRSRSSSGSLRRRAFSSARMSVVVAGAAKVASARTEEARLFHEGALTGGTVLLAPPDHRPVQIAIWRLYQFPGAPLLGV